MAINFNQDNSGIIDLSRNIDNNQMAFVPQFIKDMFTGTPDDIQLGEEGSPIDKAKDALEKRRKELERFQQGDTSSLNLPSNNLTAMAISNYDNLFGPQTVTDAFGVNRSTLGFARPDLNTSPFNVNEVTSDGITNNVRFRDMLFNDLRNLPSDLRTSLGTTRDALTKDVSGLTNFLTNIKDKGIDIIGSGKEIALRGIGSIFGGPVGGFIGSAIGKMKTTPEQRLLKDFYEKETGLDSIGRIQGGIMQGYNPVSMFGPQGLTSAIDKRLATILKTEQKKKAKGLELSKKLIERRKQLEELKRREEQARVDATRRMAQENKESGTGGYQSSFAQDKDFMGGSGTAAEMGSF